MADTPYTFTHATIDDEGIESSVDVSYSRATVRTSLERRRLLGKLLDSYNYLDDPDGQIPSDEYDNIEQYCAAMAQCKSNAAWWTSSNVTPQQVRTAYELFLEQDPLLHRLFQVADTAVAIPKKTIERT